MKRCLCGDPKCKAMQTLADLKSEAGKAETALHRVIDANNALGLPTPPGHMLVLALAASILETFQTGADAVEESMQHAASVADMFERSGVADPATKP